MLEKDQYKIDFISSTYSIIKSVTYEKEET